MTAAPSGAASEVGQVNSASNKLPRPARTGLTAVEVVHIRERRAAGAKAVDLAAEYGVSVSLVCQICTGDLWASVGGPRTRKLRDARRPAADRFWEQVAKGDPDECWPWTGGVDGDGYGRFYLAGGAVQANRFALELKLERPLGDDEVARHTCDNPPCCNGDHLIEGSRADNSADAVERQRQARGERSGTAKLTEAQATEIKALAGSVPFAVLAQRFGVSDRAVRYIAEGRRWKHLPAARAAEARS